MATTGTKRFREQKRREQKQNKDERRRQRREAAREAQANASGEHGDPDIAGIVPGPQPVPEE